MTGMVERMHVQHLDEAHWERVRKMSPPPVEYVVTERAISEQFVRCSYPVREPMVATGDCCRKRATSQVKTGDNWLNRCTDHEGLVRGTDVGEVRTSSRVRVLA